MHTGKGLEDLAFVGHGSLKKQYVRGYLKIANMRHKLSQAIYQKGYAAVKGYEEERAIHPPREIRPK